MAVRFPRRRTSALRAGLTHGAGEQMRSDREVTEVMARGAGVRFAAPWVIGRSSPSWPCSPIGHRRSRSRRSMPARSRCRIGCAMSPPATILESRQLAEKTLTACSAALRSRSLASAEIAQARLNRGAARTDRGLQRGHPDEPQRPQRLFQPRRECGRRRVARHGRNQETIEATICAELFARTPVPSAQQMLE